MENIAFDDFMKLDLRVAQIIEATAVPKTDKLVHLRIDIGEDELRDVVAGIREHYQPVELVGRQILYLANLEPRKLRGIMSSGMILAASQDGSDLSPPVLSLFSPDKVVLPGTRVG